MEHPCPICATNDGLKMSVHIDEIPYFGEHTQITLGCDACGWRRTDFIPAESRGPTGNRISINPDTLSARVIRGSSGTIRIPELGLEVEPGNDSSGYVSNIEGVLVRFRDTVMMLQRSQDPENDPIEEIEKIDSILSSLELALSGEVVDLNIEILDPMGHSGILHSQTKNWKLTDEECEGLAIGSDIPIIDSEG